jgi:hypothetical protein
VAIFYLSGELEFNLTHQRYKPDGSFPDRIEKLFAVIVLHIRRKTVFIVITVNCRVQLLVLYHKILIIYADHKIFGCQGFAF